MPTPPAARRPERPLWLYGLLILAVAFAGWIWHSALYREIAHLLIKGLGVTLFVTAVAFPLACALGLIIAMMSLSQRSRAAREVARAYVELIRGIPMLVLLYFLALGLTPMLVNGWNWLSAPLQSLGWLEPLRTRDIDYQTRVIFALMIGYSAFIAEVFRAGIQSVDKGQIEAAMAVGLTRWQCFRLVVLPQAIRTILPSLGNDFVAMLKDSSLVSVLGVADLTQMAKVYASGNFRFFETYAVLAYAYLLLTVSLSILLRRLERHLRRAEATRQSPRPPA